MHKTAEANDAARMQDDQPMVELRLTIDQARALLEATDTYMRLCIGQLDVVSRMVSFGTIPLASEHGPARKTASAQAIQAVEACLNGAKMELGYSRGGSNGITHPHVHITGHRAWEINKVLSKAVAEHRNPDPVFRGVAYDGLVFRLTNDPVPQARVITPAVKATAPAAEV